MWKYLISFGDTVTGISTMTVFFTYTYEGNSTCHLKFSENKFYF